VKVRVRCGERELTTVALLNTGFESDEPEILLPLRAAERLGLWPPPAGARTETYVSASGYMRVVRVPRAGTVAVLAEDRCSEEVPADFIISELTDEVLLNDRLIGRLRIVILDPGEGLWRFRDEDAVRGSERAERWL